MIDKFSAFYTTLIIRFYIMGCGSHYEKAVVVIEDRPSYLGKKEIKAQKKEYDTNQEKLELLLNLEKISRDSELIKREEDYFVFLSKYDEYFHAVGFDKHSFKEAFLCKKAKDALTKLFYSEEFNIKEIVVEKLLDVIDSVEDEMRDKLIKLFESYKSIFKKDVRAMIWNGWEISKEYKDYIIHNLLMDDDVLFESICIILSPDDLRNRNRLYSLGEIINKNRPKSIYICMKPIGENYSHEMKYRFDCSNISVLISDVSNLKDLKAFIISLPQNIDSLLCPNQQFEESIIKISKCKELKILGLIRIDNEDSNIAKEVFQFTRAEILFYEPTDLKQKLFRNLFLSYLVERNLKKFKLLSLFGSSSLEKDDIDEWIKTFESNSKYVKANSKLDWILLWNTSISIKQFYI